jgi:hypothetical protein
LRHPVYSKEKSRHVKGDKKYILSLWKPGNQLLGRWICTDNIKIGIQELGYDELVSAVF